MHRNWLTNQSSCCGLLWIRIKYVMQVKFIKESCTYSRMKCLHTVQRARRDQQQLALQHNPEQTSCRNLLLGLGSEHPDE